MPMEIQNTRKRTVMRARTTLLVLLTAVLLSACRSREEMPFSTDPVENIEALWQIIDTKYCYVESKGIDWQAIHDEYAAKAALLPKNDPIALFDLCASMLDSLHDGHVNLYSEFDRSYNTAWYDSYPDNYNSGLLRNYLKDYRIAESLYYCTIDNGNVGYVYYSSFSNAFGGRNIRAVLNAFNNCKGLIIDVRNNGGGDLTNAQRLAGRFTNEKILVGYMCHKTGKGHDDFSEPRAEYIEPSQSIRWQKPVVVLVNRSCYSAANTFVRNMKEMPLVTIMGDQTGGGSGMPFSSELPIGWSVRFSASPSFDARMQQIEFGIEPDVEASLDEALAVDGKDSMIEAARALLAD